jgi:ABC-type nitrate/sulfonate/bicarbonate transport system ATPase subunit
LSHLKVSHIAKSFRQNQVFNDLSFSIKKDEFVSILGPSGSGKSTIFSLIGGLLKPEEGSIELAGRSILGNRGSISYMPQTPSLLPWRTVLQNVLLGQELQGCKDVKKAEEMLVKAGLANYIHAYPGELSGGMKQRVAFIRALLSPQSLICLDEPFSALDELTRQDMQKWLLSMWQEHKRTIIFVTHSIEEALFLSDRVIILSAKPAHISADFRIPFLRPRGEGLLLEDEFFQWKRKVTLALREGEGTSHEIKKSTHSQ